MIDFETPGHHRRLAGQTYPPPDRLQSPLFPAEPTGQEGIPGHRHFRPHLAAGLTYYLANFFTPAGQPKYYDHDLYPIDIHAPAQLVITLYRLGCLDEHRHLVERVLSWTIEYMQDPRGFFIYQKGRYLSSRIPNMRWAQAWMFFALTTWQRAMAA